MRGAASCAGSSNLKQIKDLKLLLKNNKLCGRERQTEQKLVSTKKKYILVERKLVKRTCLKTLVIYFWEIKFTKILGQIFEELAHTCLILINCIT